MEVRLAAIAAAVDVIMVVAAAVVVFVAVEPFHRIVLWPFQQMYLCGCVSASVYVSVTLSLCVCVWGCMRLSTGLCLCIRTRI